MTTFRFNFSGEDEIRNNIEETKETIRWLDSEEVVPDKQIQNLDYVVTRAKMFACGDVEIGHVVISEAMARVEESGLKNAIELAEKEHSDLVAGKYEGVFTPLLQAPSQSHHDPNFIVANRCYPGWGISAEKVSAFFKLRGLKIWECTYDLIQYLVDNQADIKFDKSHVLDLGCGAGILGIYAFLNHSNVTFQDYNKEVLEHFTMPNVLLNIEEEENREMEIKRCKFYSGDWDLFNKKLPGPEVYDVILTSETIYNEDNYGKLISLFVDRLSKKGAAYVAAKTYYFGVGGGIRQFEQNIQKHEKLTSEVCWKSTGGIQREILKITHK